MKNLVFFPGNITLYDIYTAMPWSNTIDVVSINGSTLKSVLEHAVSKYKPNDPDFMADPGGRFLQVSGLIIKYDIHKPYGSRLLTAYTGQPGDFASKKIIENNKGGLFQKFHSKVEKQNAKVQF